MTLGNFLLKGKTDPTNKAQFVIPFGFGLKFKFSHRFMFAFEYGIRRTFTDYIDDVSTSYPDDPANINYHSPSPF